MKKSVKDKLDKRMYDLINLPYIDFAYGSIDFFDEKTIDEGQNGFRYNGLTGEPIKDWVGDEYVIIGYDSNMLSEYSDYFYNQELNEETKKEIINKIHSIECKDSISDYWDSLLNRAMPFED